MTGFSYGIFTGVLWPSRAVSQNTKSFKAKLKSFLRRVITPPYLKIDSPYIKRTPSNSNSIIFSNTRPPNQHLENVPCSPTSSHLLPTSQPKLPRRRLWPRSWLWSTRERVVAWPLQLQVIVLFMLYKSSWSWRCSLFIWHPSVRNYWWCSGGVGHRYVCDNDLVFDLDSGSEGGCNQPRLTNCGDRLELSQSLWIVRV